MTAISAAITLFLLIDPVGNSPVFLATLSRLTPRQRRRAILRELLFALAVLVIFLFFGQVILNALNINQAALATAGGVVLFIVAMRMIFPGRHGSGPMGESDGESPDPWFVPLAVPMVAGPSAMAFVMLLSTREPEQIWIWLAVVLGVWVAAAVILMGASLLQPYLKPGGLRALERLVGMILIVIAVQMLMDGIGLALIDYGVIEGAADV